MKNVKTEIQKMNLAQLNELSEFISDMKVMVGKSNSICRTKSICCSKNKENSWCDYQN